MKNKQGISLIVLIITIIVVIILAAAIILNLSNTNLISSAEKAKFLNDVDNFKAELETYKFNMYIEDNGIYDPDLLFADESSATYDEGNIDGVSDIEGIITTMDESYQEIFEIYEGILVLKGTVTDQDTIDWSEIANVDPIPGATPSAPADIVLNTINNKGGASNDYFESVIEVSDGYIAVGYSYSNLNDLTGGTTSQGFRDFVIAKFNLDLSLNTIKNLGGTSDDYFYDVIEVADGYIAVGDSSSDLSGLTGGSANEYSDFVIAKFNTDLSLNTIKTSGGSSGNDYLRSIVEVVDGYVAVGRSSADFSGFTGGTTNYGDSDFVIVKFGTDLSIDRATNIGGTDDDYFESVVEVADGYVAVGNSRSDLNLLTGGSLNQGSNDFVIAKFNTDLTFDKITNKGGTSTDEFYSVIEVADGYVAVGASQSDLIGLTGGSVNTGDGNYDFAIAKFNTDLSLNTINNIAKDRHDYFYDVMETNDGYVAVGKSSSDLSDLNGGTTCQGSFGTDFLPHDFVIAKFNTDLSFNKITNTGGDSYDGLYAAVKVSDGYVAVGNSQSDLTGLTELLGGSTNTGGYDFIISKFGDE